MDVSDEEEAATPASLVDEEAAAKFEATIGAHLCRYSIIKDACVVCGLTGAELVALQRKFSF